MIAWAIKFNPILKCLARVSTHNTQNMSNDFVYYFHPLLLNGKRYNCTVYRIDIRLEHVSPSNDSVIVTIAIECCVHLRDQNQSNENCAWNHQSLCVVQNNANRLKCNILLLIMAQHMISSVIFVRNDADNRAKQCGSHYWHQNNLSNISQKTVIMISCVFWFHRIQNKTKKKTQPARTKSLAIQKRSIEMLVIPYAVWAF